MHLAVRPPNADADVATEEGRAHIHVFAVDGEPNGGSIQSHLVKVARQDHQRVT